ncbi:hypothetical protein SAMN05660297_03571 [Natronincola peptidivorans]|uniref:DUF4829 domain-containing protein n=1 Tax=Natronincola peptidivorans TaxID=426128 RepID=A0A1I0HAR1_9FIRM|nr:hypothetical protein [Natronincola peptidivorans]SET80716.1 hypothetical protein SAMN05660297_03571 [Natronincola peptidivorans]
MKKIVVLFFLVILAIGHENIIFASFKNQEIEDEAIGQYLQEVFEERVQIWNEFMMKGDKDLQSIKKQLMEYTTEPLLSFDMNAFEDLLKNPTSYEIIRDVSIERCQSIEMEGSNRTYLVEIFWVVEAYEELHREEVEYIVIMEKINDKWLLSDYQLNR